MTLKTWQTIKEAIGKENCNQYKFPTKIVVDGKNITNILSITENFIKYFTEIGPNLAHKIDPPSKHFHEHLKEYQTPQPENVISVNEFKDELFPQKYAKVLVMTTLVSMLSKSASEFYTNLCCIILTFLFKLGFSLVLYLKEVEIGN